MKAEKLRSRSVSSKRNKEGESYEKDNAENARMVFSTYQTMMNSIDDVKTKDGKKLFTVGHFDLIIVDEAHRSISGSNRSIFEYFPCYKLWLTATPKDYLKNLDKKKMSEEDPRQIEKRQLLSTYATFWCESGEPTFRYSLLDGVKDGFLVNPVTLDCRTEITTQLLSDEGYAVQQETENGEEEVIYHGKSFEKRFFSEETNKSFCKVFFTFTLFLANFAIKMFLYKYSVLWKENYDQQNYTNL